MSRATIASRMSKPSPPSATGRHSEGIPLTSSAMVIISVCISCRSALASCRYTHASSSTYRTPSKKDNTYTHTHTHTRSTLYYNVHLIAKVLRIATGKGSAQSVMFVQHRCHLMNKTECMCVYVCEREVAMLKE